MSAVNLNYLNLIERSQLNYNVLHHKNNKTDSLTYVPMWESLSWTSFIMIIKFIKRFFSRRVIILMSKERISFANKPQVTTRECMLSSPQRSSCYKFIQFSKMKLAQRQALFILMLEKWKASCKDSLAH